MTHSGICLLGLCWWSVATAASGTPGDAPDQAGSWLVQSQTSPKQPHSGQPVKLTVQVRPELPSVTLEYQIVDPGAYVELNDPAYTNNWTPLPMRRVEGAPSQTFFEADLPAEVQKNRRLIRYRFAAPQGGHRLSAPNPQSSCPNYAYFVYDGVPAWTAAIDPKSKDSQLSTALVFPPEAMGRIQIYHLLGKKRSIENATWNEQSSGKEYRYTGTLVVDGEVFDHTHYRARGGVWRYAMSKNMWKFALPKGHELHAHDDFGREYPVGWTKVNLRACIQQGDYGERGEQGMFESVGFRLFNLARVPAPFTHWVQLRIVDEAKEAPSDQYRGDFWGLYLAIENEDGRFLKAHDLPSGNLFKMMGGGGLLQHSGAGMSTNGSDLFQFMSDYSQGRSPDAWWRTNVDLKSYYSYRAVCECIHHYDVGEGKNYDFYHNPKTRQWQVLPWDIDLTWADHMYGSGEEPFKRRVLSRPAFRIEFQNRLREIRDLLFNNEQTGQLIDEYASVIWDPSDAPSIVEADRRKWDYHPAMNRGMKAGQGLFYQAAPGGDFRGMVQLMKVYVKTRSAWIDAHLLGDPQVPLMPAIVYTGPAGFPSNQLHFRCSEYQGPNPFASLQWRIAEIRTKQGRKARSREPQPNEITAVWESEELSTASRETIIPSARVNPDHTYRVRARVKDVTGRWSHWSGPVEFTPQSPR